MTEHSHYYRDIPKWLKRLDIYRLLDLFGVTCPCAQHVAKKALVAGQRGHKDIRKDWEDIRDTAIRRLQMMDEERDDKESQIKHAAEAGQTFIATASPLDSLPTIKRSELPEWVPSDAGWFAGAHGLRRIIDDTPEAPADPFMPSDEEWKVHPWARWSVTDKTGGVFLCEEEPRLAHVHRASWWNVCSGKLYRTAEDRAARADWKLSIRKRPSNL